jgi:16S rRNA processing protein RimM
MEQGLVKIGKLTRLHGVRGALLLHLDSGPGPDTEKLTSVFVEINGTPTPFFIAELKPVGKNLAITFDSVGSTQEAQRLAGREAWIERKFLRKQKQAADLTGYTLVDARRGEVGVVKEMLDMPGQRLLALEVQGREVLLPFNDDLVQKTDAKKKIIYYSAPEGLIDVFLD